MTTTITVKTHSWPVRVTTTDRYFQEQKSGDAEQRIHTVTTTIETVPPESERSFYITNSRSVAFDEMPLPEDPSA